MSSTPSSSFVRPVLVLVALLVAAGSASAAPPDLVLGPIPAHVDKYEQLAIEMTCADCDSVRIDPDGPVWSFGPGFPQTQIYNRTMLETTEFVLTATNADGTDVEEFTVIVDPVPPIVSFSVEVRPWGGFPFAIRATVREATSVTLEPGFGEIGNGEFHVTPIAMETTEYVLHAVNDVGEVTRRRTMVPQPPAINEFSLPEGFFSGVEVELSFQTRGAKSITLEPGVGTIATDLEYPSYTDSRLVAITDTTVFVLRAENPAGVATREVTAIPDPPVIDVFGSAQAWIAAGQTAQLEWSTRGAATVEILRGDEVVHVSAEVAGAIDVSPGETTEYRLRATNPVGTAEARATVVVRDASTLPDVTLTGPEGVVPGESFDLELSVEGADSTFLEPLFGRVPGSGTYSALLESTTTFTARGFNAAGEATATWTVELRPPLIQAFVADPLEIDPGESSRLAWSTAGATQVRLLAGDEILVDDSPPASEITVSPEVTTTYVLRAENVGGVSEAEVTVSVSTIAIEEFTADPAVLPNGGPTTLSWSARGTGELELVGFGPVPLAGSLVVEPDSTTTFELVGTFGGVEIDRAVVTVPVFEGGVDRVQWSWASDRIERTSSGVQPYVPFSAWVVVEDPLGGLGGFELRAVVPSELLVVAAAPVPPGAVTVSGHPDWVVGTGACVEGAIIPILAYEFLTVGPLAEPVVLDLTGIPDPSLPSGEPAYGQCSTELRPLRVGQPLVVFQSGSAPPIDIEEFTADPPAISEGGSSTLSWRASGAGSLELVGVGPVPIVGSRVVSPNSTTTYELVATDDDGGEVDRVTVTVTVSALPVEGDRVSWSWAPDRVDTDPREVSAFVPTSAWIVAENPTGGLTGFELRTVVPPELFVLDAAPVPPGSINVGVLPDWVVGTGECLAGAVVPLLEVTFFAQDALDVPVALDITGVAMPSLPRGEPAYADCELALFALEIGTPLVVERHGGPPVAAMPIELRAAEGPGIVSLRWSGATDGCASRVLVFRATGAAPMERVATLTGAEACGSWDDPDPPVRLDDVTYRVVVERESGALASPQVVVERAPAGLRDLSRSRLLANVPNPFNPATEIRFWIAARGPVDVAIFDSAGRRVRGFDLGPLAPGAGSVTWNGRDDAGRPVGSGVYLVRLVSVDRVDTRRVLLIK